MTTAGLRGLRARLLVAASLAGLVLVEPGIARAQGGDGQAQPDPARPGDARPDDRNVIIVIGGRTIIAALANVAVEDSYDEDAVSAYGVDSVGEVLDSIRRDNGDDDPAFLVNGRPVTSPDDIAGLPAEAIQRIEVLPKGSATRIGGQPGQRAYNVVLRPALKSATLTASYEEATEGGWSNTRGEAVLTWIKGQDRVNLSVRGGKSTALYEAERAYDPRPLTTPYSPLGNIIPISSASGAEIDPVLSALAGRPISVLALPAGVSNPTLATLLPGAGRTNPSNEGFYRTLRGPSRPIDVNLTGNKQFSDWLSLSFNARLGWSRNENFNGLPSARFTIPGTNPFTPFSGPVVLALSDGSRPLLSVSDGNTQAVSATLNAQRGPWHAALTAKWDRRENSYISRFTGTLLAADSNVTTTNPFAGTLAAAIPIKERVSTSSNDSKQVLFEIQGPVAALWAGPISARATLGANWVDYQAEDSTGPRSLRRTELTARAGISVPLTSKQFGFLPQLGESDIDFDYGTTDLGAFGKLTRRSLAFNWQPAPWVRLVALDSREERAVVPELLAAPQVITPNVPYFDPLTGETVDVTLIYGGVGSLADEEYRIRSVALTLTPLKQYGVQFNAEYAVNDTRNQVGPLPLPSPAVVAAFPDRFIRDSLGFLTTVDSRSINFARQRSEVLRFGFRFALPLTKAGELKKDASGRRTRIPPMRLSFTLNHTVLLNSTAVIRSGLPEVDLIAGGAIGIGGGQTRNATRASLALNRGATGIRLDYDRRGASRLATGTLAAPDLLRFDPLATFDLRAFTDLDAIFPKAGIPRGTRITMSIDNLFNARQQVTNNAGITPQAYQPVRRDPVGRTVMVELRLAL